VRQPTRVETAELTLPVGTIRVATRDGTLCALGFADRWDRLGATLARRFGAVALVPARDPGGVVTSLHRYLDGNASALDALAVDTAGTPFQHRVWEALRRIPYGTTMSYGELARRIAAPSAVRAVAAANGANPISIVIPCHRVIGGDGSLTGYGGGLERKRWLLAHEGAAAVDACLPFSS
jgi:methylated-DNA-[protein]-cysteine S-methyltransferase